jgi:beta-mannosidase
VVNGLPIFAKGANWIPSDSFPTRVTATQLEHLVRSAAEANHNMLRAWGGGYYEDERFFDLCDRYGILVWQDFQFACAVYPLHDPVFVENVRVEVEQAVRRLRHRACLALWCGNNEMETGWVEWGWSGPDTEDLKAAYHRFFYGTLPAWLRSLDPDLPYWPSSPSSHDLSEHPNSNAVGDNHLWDVWHAMKPISHYRTQAPRFASEFGLQSLPALATIETYAEPADRNMTSYVMEHHQRHPNGNGKIVAYLAAHYRLPTGFSALVYLSQVLQAEGMRVAVEHWRRIRARCSGTLFWQLNDCWPVASWSSIDYEGRWKALHYASRRFYAPVLLSIDDQGDRMGIHVTNDTTAAWEGEVRWTLETLDGDVLDGGVDRVTAGPSATTLVGLHDFTAQVDPEARRALVVVAALWHDGVRRSLACAPFVPDKHLELRPPDIALATAMPGGGGERRLEIRATASSLARFVELALDGADVVFTDNFFDLPAGREVLVTCPIPDGWSDEQAGAAVRVRSLFDSYHDA